MGRSGMFLLAASMVLAIISSSALAQGMMNDHNQGMMGDDHMMSGDDQGQHMMGNGEGMMSGDDQGQHMMGNGGGMMSGDDQGQHMMGNDVGPKDKESQ